MSTIVVLTIITNAALVVVCAWAIVRSLRKQLVRYPGPSERCPVSKTHGGCQP